MNKAVRKFLEKYEAEKSSENRLTLVNDFVNMYYDSNFTQIDPILEKELSLAVKSGNVNAEALLRYMLSYSAFETGQLTKGEEGFRRVIEIFPHVTDHSVRAQIRNFQAFIESHQGNYEKALEFVYDCIRESELAPKKKNQYWGLYTLGVLYFDMKDMVNSEKNFRSAAENFKKFNNEYGVARSETGISSVCIYAGRFDEAEQLLRKSLAFYKEEEVLSGISRSLNDLGVLYKKTGRNKEALACFEEALQIRKDTSHTQGVATTLNEIGELQILLKDFAAAERFLKEGMEVSQFIGNRSKLYRTHYLLSQLYRQTDQPWKALEHYEYYDKLKSEVTGETATNKINELQKRMATEKADREKEIERLRNVELKSALDKIEQQNKDIRDSIHYARRIQRALLASDDLLKKHLKNYFILYLPKDIVSGDFYWAVEHEDRFYMAVSDCTGHGVPGAFMSLLNISYMNEAIVEKNVRSVNEVFDHVRARLIGSISADGGQDGMDGVLFSIDKGRLQYVAANNAPILIRDGELQELPVDKMPVGKSPKGNAFSKHAINGGPGDMLYLITDGFKDQFGGPAGKKYKHKNFVSLLKKIHAQPLERQRNELQDEFEKWKGSQEQVDDVLVIGIRL